MADRTRPPASEIEALKKHIRRPGATPFIKVCVYARNGGGKTRFAGTAPKLLLIDCNEEGDRSIKGREGVRVLPVRNWHQIGAAYWYLKSGNHPFESVAIDTITEMNAMAMDFVLGEAEDRDPTREKSMPDKRSYGRTGQLMRAMLLAYRNLPMHVIFTAQERRVRDQDTEEVLEITVDLPNASRGTAMGCVGVLGRLEPREIRVRMKGGKVARKWRDHLRLAPDEVIQTKDRTYALGEVVVNPTVPQIIKAWHSSPPKESD